MPKLKSALIIVLIFSIFGCETKDPAIDAPSYLYIPSFSVKNENNQSNMDIFSENISDVWVYLDNDNQGAYELPALIPISKSGNHRVELRPGIKNAGIGVSRRPYPYYELYNLGIYNLKKNVIDSLEPITYYTNKPAIIVAWEEGFEGPGVDYTLNPRSDTIVNIIDSVDFPDLVFKDSRSGAIFMDGNDFLFEMISPTLTNLPISSIPIYLEINYKSNQDFIVGLYKDNKTQQIPIYVVKEQENWNKIYLDFTTYIQSSARGTNFNIFIGFTRSSSVPKVEMYLDNIKLIHFP